MNAEKIKSRWHVTMSTCKYFYDYIVRFKSRYIACVSGYILFVAIGPFINIIIPKYIIDELMGNHDVYILISLIVVIVIGNFAVGTILRILNENRIKQEDWLSREFEMQMSRKTMEMEFAKTEIDKTIEAERKAVTGMSWYSGGIHGLSDCVIAIISSSITLIGVTCIVAKVSIWLIFFATIVVIINAIATSKSNKAQQDVFEKTPVINKFYNYIYQEVTDRKYAKELRLYDATGLVAEKALENAKSLNRLDNECAIKQSIWGIVGGVSSSLCYGISYCWLGSMAINGQIAIAEFVLCATALESFSNNCLTPIIKNVQDIVMKSNFMNAYVEFMNIDSEEMTGDKSIKKDEFECIEFEHVYFKYPGSDNFILQDISFSVRKGERISLVGLNGSGKSTMVKLLCRLYSVSKGVIKVNGRNIEEYKYSDYIKLLAVVFQDFKLFSYTIDENIRISGQKDEFELQNIYAISGITKWIASLKKKGDTLLYKDYDSEGIEPSGGEAQKVAIARALYQNAPIVILDEPTAALDPVAEYEIYNHFNELVNERTAIYISHRLSSCKFCDKIIVIDNKRIVEIGNHKELLERNGIYAKMFQTQAQWYVEE